jgi:hypothetical protein
MLQVRDDRAKQILFKTYWSKSGWVNTPPTPQADFEYAVEAGYMFQPFEASHDEIVSQIVSIRSSINHEDIAAAFLASLSSRQLELRSALGSYAVAKSFPKHTFQVGISHGNGSSQCKICHIYSSHRQVKDLNVLNFERYKWGGVRHDNSLYIAFDLEQFQKIGRVEPQVEDLAIMRKIIDIISTTKLRDLEKNLSKILPSNKSEREILLEILSYSGILQSKDKTDAFTSSVNDTDREISPSTMIDWNCPTSWWRGSDGVNLEALTYYFGSFGL